MTSRKSSIMMSGRTSNANSPMKTRPSAMKNGGEALPSNKELRQSMMLGGVNSKSGNLRPSTRPSSFGGTFGAGAGANARESIARASVNLRGDGSEQGQMVIENDRLKTTLTILNQKLKVQQDENLSLKATIEGLNQDLEDKD